MKNAPFSEKVYASMRRIPRGKVSTYKALAKAAGHPKAARAVGNACNANPDAPRTPCHRVIASDGSLGGYAHGLKKKVALLEVEGVEIARGKIDLGRFGYRFK